MIDVFVATSHTIEIPLIENGEENFISFQEGRDSIVYSILDTNGVPLENFKEIDLAINATNPSIVQIPLPCDINTIDEDNDFTIRFVDVTCTLNGSYIHKRVPYRIIKFVPYTVTKDEVRNIFGLTSNVITDDMLDLYSSYLKVKQNLGDRFDEAITSFGLTSQKANRIIALTSAISLEVALPIIVAKIESDSIVSQTRFTMTKDDFMDLISRLKGELEELTDEITGDTADSMALGFVIGSFDDIFTGGQ